MDKVYGAYLCTGCGIGDALDVDGLKEAAKEEGMELKEHACLCGSDGRAMIEKDIASDGVNTLVIGACSPRVMKREFDFGNGTMTVRPNLREQVAWIKYTSDDAPEEHEEYINEIGQNYVRMGCVNAQKSTS